jgi:hypothetical protein
MCGPIPASFEDDPARHLDGLRARSVAIFEVPGATHTMMEEPHVRVLGDRLKARLDARVHRCGDIPAA